MGGGNRPKPNIPRPPGGLSPRGRGKRDEGFPINAPVGSIPAWAGETYLGVGVTSRPQVYPRVGGGNPIIAAALVANSGLSPRGRGKPDYRGRPGGKLGSIPAWAGETNRASLDGMTDAVYPRVGGGNPQRQRKERQAGGLSPRGRGKRRSAARSGQGLRSIPAWAGETAVVRLQGNLHRVYPRVGGGNLDPSFAPRSHGGLSPRGRGKRPPARAGYPIIRSIPAWAGETARQYHHRPPSRVYPRVGGGNDVGRIGDLFDRGLSPRGRGKLHPAMAWSMRMRSIPAWAGETPALENRVSLPAVYPRVGGGNSIGGASPKSARGLSPRGRGKPPPSRVAAPAAGSIPAWAGETAAKPGCCARRRVYPRVGGGNSRFNSSSKRAVGLSPRGRGKPETGVNPQVLAGSIPAWAGETMTYSQLLALDEVYPRVGGGNPDYPNPQTYRNGLSPRGRGKPPSATAAGRLPRSIPAWAGETSAGAALYTSAGVYPRVGGGNLSA